MLKPRLKLYRDLAADRREAIAKLIGQNPPPTQQQIAEAVGITQQRVSQITSEIQATTTPKLLNHGGKREGQAYSGKVANYGNSKEFILARLKRDGRDDLAEQVGDGSNTKNETLTARVISYQSARPTPFYCVGKLAAAPSATRRH